MEQGGAATVIRRRRTLTPQRLRDAVDAIAARPAAARGDERGVQGLARRTRRSCARAGTPRAAPRRRAPRGQGGSRSWPGLPLTLTGQRPRFGCASFGARSPRRFGRPSMGARYVSIQMHIASHVSHLADRARLHARRTAGRDPHRRHPRRDRRPLVPRPAHQGAGRRGARSTLRHGRRRRSRSSTRSTTTYAGADQAALASDRARARQGPRAERRRHQGHLRPGRRLRDARRRRPLQARARLAAARSRAPATTRARAPAAPAATGSRALRRAEQRALAHDVERERLVARPRRTARPPRRRRSAGRRPRPTAPCATRAPTGNGTSAGATLRRAPPRSCRSARTAARTARRSRRGRTPRRQSSVSA